MNNKHIARVFEDIADLLEMKGENVFKIRAYQKAGRVIGQLPVEVEQLVREGRLGEVPGVGKAIADKLTELAMTGRLEYYEKLKAESPPGVFALLGVPGIGPKTAMLLYNELKIGSVDELERAILEGKVAALPRMGEKTAENILQAIRALRRKDQRIPIGEAFQAADDLIARLREVPGVQNLVAAGSLRRFCETVGNIDLLCTADEPEAVIGAFTSLPAVKEVVVRGMWEARIILASGMRVDLRVAAPGSFGSALQYFTGSKQHNIVLRATMAAQGLEVSEYGVTNAATGETEQFATEEALYTRLGLHYIPPELREGTEEIERAATGAIPRLVDIGDIKGDLHVHSNWSDGRDSIESMVQAAKALGYEYVCISDHSGGRGIARGLNHERLEQQLLEIERLKHIVSDIHILSGIEVDIRADGTLDMPDEVLEKVDVVTGSVHSGMNQTSEQMTARISKAMQNPHMDVLGHPTGRLIQEREPVAVDMEAILETALRTHTILEINAMPSRLDLKDTHVYRARELGVPLVINTDSHASEHLSLMLFGIGVARRGWCEARHIVNTLPLPELLDLLGARNA